MKQTSDKPLRRHVVGMDTIVDQRDSDSMGLTAGIFVVILLLVLTLFVSKQSEEIQTVKLQKSTIEQNQIQEEEEAVAFSVPENPEDSSSQGDQIIESLDPIYPPAD